MACDQSASYTLNYPWVALPSVNEAPGTTRTFAEWTAVLLITGSDLCDYMLDYPAWFTQAPAPGIVTSWRGYDIGDPARTGAVTAQDGDYSTDMIDPGAVTTIPGATLNDQLEWLRSNGGGSDFWRDPISSVASIPPVSPPALGVRILVGTGASGLFTGHEQEIAISDGLGAYSFEATADGVVCGLLGSPGVLYRRDGLVFAPVRFDDRKVFTDNLDATAKFLADAINNAGDTYVQVNVVTASPGNRVIEITTTGIIPDDDKALVSGTDTTPGFLFDKIDIPGFAKSITNSGANEILTLTPSGGGGGGGAFPVSVYRDIAGGLTVPASGAWVDVTFATADLVSSVVTRSGAEFICAEAGTLVVGADVTLQTGFSRCQHEVRVVRDTGGGYNAVAYMEAIIHTDNNIADLHTVVLAPRPLIVSVGHKFKVQVRASIGTLDATTLGDYTSMFVFRMEAAGGGGGGGTGDFVGPASAVDSNFVLFDGTTGKLGKDSGVNAASFDAAGAAAAAQAAAIAASQPLDSDLSAIAALAPADGDWIQRVAGAWLNRTIAQLKEALGYVEATTTSDFGTTSTTYVDVTGAAVALAASTDYDITIMGDWTSSNNSGQATFGITVPAGATFTMIRSMGITSSAVTTNMQNTADQASLVAIGTATALRPFLMEIRLTTAGTAGNLQLRLASNNASYTATCKSKTNVRARAY